jgi:hypothetical protein
MSEKVIHETREYGRFQRHTSENRPLDLKKHGKLFESMKRYGFLRCFPIVVVRRADGKLVVKDGQHRLAIAETLGLPIYYVIEEADFDVAFVCRTQKNWQAKDYALRWAAMGNTEYQQALDFAEHYGIPVGLTFSLLAGTVSFTNCNEQFYSGTWRIRDLSYGVRVASLYQALREISHDAMGSARVIEALMMVCRVNEFDQERLLANARKASGELKTYSTKEGYLDAMEDLYNRGKVKAVGLKALAINAMRERNAAKKKKQAKAPAAPPAAAPEAPPAWPT